MDMSKGIERSAAAAEWARRVEEQEKSGLSIREFAEQQGLKPGSLSFWRWKLARSGHAAGLPAVTPLGFVELTAVPSPAPEPRSEGLVFEIGLASDRSIRVPAGFDASELARLVAVLEGVRS
jgi:hypothetical protein